ncbi:MAG TPA: hypothetical protein VFQ78_01025, partial [Candidatus Udaeobacter sp.]|nr:hypothetical protein [Candidatus Udaeobacter sp.]
LLIGYRQRAYAIKRAAIVIGSQVDPSSHTFARMLWKVGYFGRLSMNVCAVRKFGLTFSLNAMLMPAQPRD